MQIHIANYFQYREVIWLIYWEILHQGDKLYFNLSLSDGPCGIQALTTFHSNPILSGEIDYIICKVERTKSKILLREDTLKLFTFQLILIPIAISPFLWCISDILRFKNHLKFLIIYHCIKIKLFTDDFNKGNVISSRGPRGDIISYDPMQLLFFYFKTFCHSSARCLYHYYFRHWPQTVKFTFPVVKKSIQGYYISTGDTTIKIKLIGMFTYTRRQKNKYHETYLFYLYKQQKIFDTNILISICHTMLLTTYHQLIYQEVAIDVMCQEDAFLMTFKYHNPKWWCRMTFFYPRTTFKKFKCFGVCHQANDAVLYLLQDIRGRKCC